MTRKALTKSLVLKVGRRRVAYECNVSPQAVEGWLAGAEPKARHLVRLVELAEVPAGERFAVLRKLSGLDD